MTVHAVAYPVETRKGELHDGMAGYGIVRFRKKAREVVFEAWPRHGGPQFDGWPITVVMPRQGRTVWARPTR